MYKIERGGGNEGFMYFFNIICWGGGALTMSYPTWNRRIATVWTILKFLLFKVV